MKIEEFGQKVKAKYPQYQDLPDAEIGQKVLSKYPSYGDLIDKVEPPKVSGLQKATNVVNKIFPGGKLGEAIGTSYAAGKELVKGNKQGFEDIIDTQVSPKAVAGDLAKIVTTSASAALPIAGSIAGKAAQFGTLGAVSGAGQAASEDKTLPEIGKQSLKSGAMGAAVGGVIGTAEKSIKGLANLFGEAGKKIQTTVIKPSQADIKDGFKIDTVNKYGLGGSLKQTFEKTDAKLDVLSKELNAKLKSSNTSLDLNSVYDKTVKRLLGNKLESFGSNAQMEGAIEKLRNEIIGVTGKNGLVSIPEAQLVKRASGHFGAWTWGVPTPEATASQKVYNTFYNELKTAIEKGSPAGVQGVNKQISDLIPVMNALIRRIPVAERNSTLSLTDIISLTAATFEPRALGLTLLNLASKSGTVGAMLTKTPALGKSVEKLEPVARSITNQLVK